MLIMIPLKVKNLWLVALQLIIELPHKVAKSNHSNILNIWMTCLNKLQHKLDVVFTTFLA
jgi:hypothetical protein